MNEETKEQLEHIGHGLKLMGKAIIGPYSNLIKIHLGPRLLGWLDVPFLTDQAAIALASSIQVKETAQEILLRHNLFDTSHLPEGQKASVDNCPLANVLGGQIEARTLLSMDFLEPRERLILVEFFQRFDRGDYPELVQQSTWKSTK